MDKQIVVVLVLDFNQVATGGTYSPAPAPDVCPEAVVGPPSWFRHTVNWASIVLDHKLHLLLLGSIGSWSLSLYLPGQLSV